MSKGEAELSSSANLSVARRVTDRLRSGGLAWLVVLLLVAVALSLFMGRYPAPPC